MIENNKERFDRKEAANYCGVSVVTIDRALAGKKISHFRIGRRVIFDRTHLDEFLNKNEYKARN
jgi:excisionase family DNA binding protein